MTDAWVSPETWPPGSQEAGVRGLVILSDGVVPLQVPTPVLGGETDLAPRPSAALCFPIHPLGAVRLYGYARSELDRLQTASDFALSEDDAESLFDSLWDASITCYSPGEPVRTGFDRLMEKRVPGVRLNDGEIAADEANRVRLRLLAIHLVVLALDRWVGDTP